MDGFSDLPFRAMARRLGSAMSYTEFVNAIEVVVGLVDDKSSRNSQRELHTKLEQRLVYEEYERPVAFQVFDDDPARLVEAALLFREFEPDIIDINMGCSAKTVSGRGAGAGLMRTPEKIAQIFRTLSDALDIPVTGKMRLGWDERQLNYLDIAKIIQDNGGQLLAVHGRTKQQAYRGVANWDAIAEIKAALKIPVIGNGDVRTVADIERMKTQTGVDGVMIGRGAIGNPWIFSKMDREQVPAEMVLATMLSHLDDMLHFYGSEQGLILFRKHASRYISPFRLSISQRQALLTAEHPSDFTALLDRILAENTIAA
jgi:nifR3 family TIM-barrel protein